MLPLSISLIFPDIPELPKEISRDILMIIERRYSPARIFKKYRSTKNKQSRIDRYLNIK